MKLCAIAKNEGAYLADWVFHHLRFGFEAVEVWVNATEDPSLRILKRISSSYPQVTGKRSDQLLEECLAEGKIFQHRAYARMARRAQGEGFTHVAFLDLDEYWAPRDFTSPIGEFLPEDADVNVVSFLWAVDVPDPARPAFLPPFAGPVRVQLDRHVKSVVRLDGSVRRYLPHTGRTTGGVRLLVRESFPMVDFDAQAGGSLVPEEHLVAHGSELPEAFVLHAINRSVPEYLGSLAKGMRQTGSGMRLKSNRLGFIPTTAPILELEPSAQLLGAYERDRRQFLTEVDVARPILRSQTMLTARGADLIEDTTKDPTQMDELRSSLRGIPSPTLDAAYPGWDGT